MSDVQLPAIVEQASPLPFGGAVARLVPAITDHGMTISQRSTTRRRQAMSA